MNFEGLRGWLKSLLQYFMLYRTPRNFCVLQNAQKFQSAHVHNNLSNFQKAVGVTVMMGKLAQQGPGITNPAGGCPIVTVNSICFLNITVFIVYMCTLFGFYVCGVYFNLFWYLFFWGCQSVRDRAAQAGTPILKMLCIYMMYHETLDTTRNL